MKNKSQLAKLLATENIEVQENAVQTASFDVVNRVLTIPVFKEEQKCKHVYDMLVGHEVSHALNTPSDSWKDMSNRSKEFRSFVNVIEDARIDKLIQKKYPGLVDDYLKGFDKMLKYNFFGTKDKDMMSYALIDKINLYYKSSKRLDFKFTNKEKILVDAVDNCKNFDDVLKLAEEILGYCKKELEKKPELQKLYKPDPKGQVKDESESDSEDSQSEKTTSEKLDEWLEKKSESKDSDDEKKKDNINATGGQGAGESGLPTEITSLTNDFMDSAIKGITDSEARERDYCCLLYTSPSPRDGLLSRMPSSA